MPTDSTAPDRAAQTLARVRSSLTKSETDYPREDALADLDLLVDILSQTLTTRRSRAQGVGVRITPTATYQYDYAALATEARAEAAALARAERPGAQLLDRLADALDCAARSGD